MLFTLVFNDLNYHIQLAILLEAKYQGEGGGGEFCGGGGVKKYSVDYSRHHNYDCDKHQGLLANFT